MKNIKERIYENTRALCEIRNERLGELEVNVLGLSPGYLSRTTHGIKIENVYRIAKHFSVTVDDLIEHDYGEEYKELLAEKELKETVKRVKKAMRGCDVLKVVNKILEEQ